MLTDDSDRLYIFKKKKLMIPKELKNKLKNKKKISLSEFIEFCLYDKNEGYYENISDITNDFLTSPEVSQLFGECISIFFLYLLEFKLSESISRIVEFGPGNGTLMFDLIRSIKSYSKFEKFEFFLLEKSKKMINIQKSKLKYLGTDNIKIKWFKKIRALEKSSCFFLCNEFFDAFPINQYVYRDNKFYEKKIINLNDKLTFKEFETDWKYESGYKLNNGDIIEHSQSIDKFLFEVFYHIQSYGGIFLLFDYGPYRKSNVDTLQAIFKKKKCGLFDQPTRSDITHHIDFERFKKIADRYNLFSIGPIPQSKFLNMFGINERLDKVSSRIKSNSLKKKLEQEFFKLTSPSEMGELFKCMIFSKEVINFLR